MLQQRAFALVSAIVVCLSLTFTASRSALGQESGAPLPSRDESPPWPAPQAQTTAIPIEVSATSVTQGGWEPIISPATLDRRERKLAVHPTDARSLMLVSHQALFRSTDSGASFEQIDFEVDGVVSPPITFTWIAYSPAQANRLFALVSLASPTALNFLRSDDEGSTWISLSHVDDPCQLAMAPGDPDRLYAARCAQPPSNVPVPILYRSTNGGLTWEGVSTPFASAIQSLAVSPGNPSLLIAAAGRGLHRSADAGQSWTSTDLSQVVRLVTFHPTRPLWALATYQGLNGLNLTIDGGGTWLTNVAVTEGNRAIFWPNHDGVASTGGAAYLGDSPGERWQIVTPAGPSQATRWQFKPWEVPLFANALIRSSKDDAILYAADGQSEFWRFVPASEPVAPPPANARYLPLVAGSPPRTDSQITLAYVNKYRASLGVAPMLEDSSFQRAAENHARYQMLNIHDPSARAGGAHTEVAGKPGFTGVTPSDRCRAAGSDIGCGEIAYWRYDPISTIDGWMESVFHRFPLVSPLNTQAGYGHAQIEDIGVGYSVLNFAYRPLSYGVWLPIEEMLQVYPYDGQSNVSLGWGASESPNPLPPGAAVPVGYSITAVGIVDELLVSEATLRDASGELVVVHPNPPDCPAFNCYALIAIEPLQPNTRYTVWLKGTHGDLPFEKTWRFTTGTEP